ncbi:hypothetical protein Tco_0857553 [Tanacetum coccineum]|uniref:Uncharacterized protein n=1 Tax=Tanacetum coccineum TaxID=301880 RepID=A0ABQ5B7F3_9ASTR
MKTLPLDQTEGTKSQPKSSRKFVQLEELVFEVADSDMPQDQEGNLGDNEDEIRNKTASRRPAFKLLKGTRSNFAELEYDFEECYKALSEKFDWENPEGGDYLFDLSKPFPLITRGKLQRVPFEYFINNDLKYLQGGVSTMTYTTSTTKTKAAQYDLPGIKDKVPNIWSLVKVAYDRYALWGISHWREQHKSFYAYKRGISRGDVYFTKCILAVTHVKVIRKHGYGYLEEIVVKTADNVLYRFKEGDFPQLRINDIEDMLILVVQNRLTNLSWDDVADFAIALRMFTRSLVIQKRVEDLQLGVESYRKHINVTKPDTIRPDLGKRNPYTPYKDPQGFIYVDDYKRNMLMRSDELYKFSDGTLTRLLSSLKDITKNIDMEYLPKRRWSTLEKKRAHFMIKDINKLLKERRMMRSLEKFVGEHPSDFIHYKDGNPASANIKQAHGRFNTTAGNLVKKILLKLNLSDHMSILMDSKEYLKMVMEYDESNTYVLERFNTTAGNLVKKILLKLNLSDHMSILMDSKEYLKMVMEVFGDLCYPKNDCEDIGKLGAKVNIGFFIAMAFEQSRSKPGLNGMTSGQINSGLDLAYASSTIKPTEHDLDLLFEAMYDDYIATHIPNTSQDVDELKPQQQHAQQQDNQAPLQPKTVVDNVLNAMLDGNMFVNPFAPPSISAAESSSLQYVDPSNMHTFYQPYPHEYLWTKDHPLEQVIGEPL